MRVNILLKSEHFRSHSIKVFKKYKRWGCDIFTIHINAIILMIVVEIMKNSFLFLIIRDIHDQDDFRHIFAQTRISILRARPFYSPLFRPDIGNKWISFPVTLVRRFILSRINARADLSFARIRFVADL